MDQGYSQFCWRNISEQQKTVPVSCGSQTFSTGPRFGS